MGMATESKAGNKGKMGGDNLHALGEPPFLAER